MSNEWNTQHSLSGKLDTFRASLDTAERAEFDIILKAALENRPSGGEVAGYKLLNDVWTWVDTVVGSANPDR